MSLFQLNEHGVSGRAFLLNVGQGLRDVQNIIFIIQLIHPILYNCVAMRYSERPAYQEEGLLGKGSFAEVYRVRLLGKLYALKRIYNYHLKDPLYLSSIKREIEIMKRIDHENIVKLIDVYQTESSLEMLLEYVPGGSLYDKIMSHDKMHESVVKSYITDLVKVIKYLHSFSEPILHRDIKPQNILLSENNKVKLCDFGSANLIMPDHTRDSYVGTAEYMAPEMKECKPHDQSLDLWSIGVLIFELLTGNLPNSDSQIEYPAFISRPAQDLMRKIMVKQQQKRISIDEILSHIWLTVEDEIPSLSSFSIYPMGRSSKQIKSKLKSKREKSKKQGNSKEAVSMEPILMSSSSQISRAAEQVAQQYVNQLKSKSSINNTIERNQQQIQKYKQIKISVQTLCKPLEEKVREMIVAVEAQNMLIPELQDTEQERSIQFIQELDRKLDKLKQFAQSFPIYYGEKILTFKQINVEADVMPVSDYLPKLKLKMLETTRNALIELKCIKKRRAIIKAMSYTEAEEEYYHQAEISSSHILMKEYI